MNSKLNYSKNIESTAKTLLPTGYFSLNGYINYFSLLTSSIALGGFGTLWSKIWKSKTVLKTPSEKNGNYIFSSNSWKSIAFFRKKDFAVLPP